jgi:hypothetical protein
MWNSKIHPWNPAISLHPFTSPLPRYGRPITIHHFFCDISQKSLNCSRCLCIPFWPAFQGPRSSLLSFSFLWQAPLPLSASDGPKLKHPPILLYPFFGRSELRWTIELITANPSDALFAFSDAPTPKPISEIVSAPDVNSNNYKLVSNRLSRPYISAFGRFLFPPSANISDLPQATSTLDDPSRISSTFFDVHRSSTSRDFLAFVFDIPRAFANFPDLFLPDLILTDSNFLELMQISNSRDSGNLPASAGCFLHEVSETSSTMRLDEVSGL